MLWVDIYVHLALWDRNLTNEAYFTHSCVIGFDAPFF